MNFSLIVCTNKENGIGFFDQNRNKYFIPWKSKTDMSFFKQITTSKENSVVIMGRNTHSSLPNNFLSDRINIVVTTKPHLIHDERVITVTSLIESLLFCKKNNFKNIFVIGGALLYKEALRSEYLDSIYWNIINNDNLCNIHFPLNFQDALLYYNLDNNYTMMKKNTDRLKFYKLNKKFIQNHEIHDLYNREV